MTSTESSGPDCNRPITKSGEQQSGGMLPCPFCGVDNLDIQNNVRGESAVACLRCEVTGTWEWTVEEAIRLWNRRAGQDVAPAPGPAGNRPTGSLTDHDWLQIQMAVNGSVSGTSDEWPDLVHAIEKVLGRKLTRQSAAWLRGFCEAIVLSRDNEARSGG